MEMIKKFLRIVFHIDNFFVSVFTVALLCLLFTVIKKLDFLNPVEKVLDLSMIDLYYQINNTGEKTINQQISIVDITQLTERQRDSMAIVVNQIAEMNPAVLGVDIIFERQLANSKADSDLMIAFFEASETIPIVMAEKLSSSNWESSNYTYITHSFFSEEV
jgi:CHASE2 domain-containing sensor protein